MNNNQLMERLASIKKANDDNTIANIFFSLGIITTLVTIYNYDRRLFYENMASNYFEIIKKLKQENITLQNDINQIKKDTKENSQSNLDIDDSKKI